MSDTEIERKDDYSAKVHVRVSTSRIAGKGLFAAQDIKKGTRIIQYIGQRISKAETAERLDQGNQYIFAFNDHYDIDGKTLKNKARYINHSCDPNCDILRTQRTIWIVAKRDIQEGEELSYNPTATLDCVAQLCPCRIAVWQLQATRESDL